MKALPILISACVIACQAQPPEPEFADVFFRLDRGNLVTLERQSASPKAKVNGFIVLGIKGFLEIPGRQSPVRFPQIAFMDFIVRNLDDVPGDPQAIYRMRRLEGKSKSRIVVVSSGRATPVHASVNSGNTDSLVPLEFTRYGTSSLRIRVSEISPGEYALGKSGGRILFCFGVD